MNPRVIDFDDGEISVRLEGKELRGWSYTSEDERRAKMLAAREYVEGWCDGHAQSSELNAELRRQIDDLVDPTLESMRLENGRFDMTLGGEAAKRLALVMTEWFRESGAKNYIEITLHAKTEPFERYQFFVQKQGDGAQTPHELRIAAEAKIAELSERSDEAAKTCNSYLERAEASEARLAEAVKHIETIIQENDDFRAGMPADWDGDPLQDACQHAKVFFDAVSGTRTEGGNE